jgi:hypothetical protein
MNRNEKDPSRISRSTKLRKYASVYKSYIRKTEQSKISKSPRHTRKSSRARRDVKETIISQKKSKNTDSTKSKRKTLNPYQKFVQQESKKEKYKDIPGKKRLCAIATEWKTIST